MQTNKKIEEFLKSVCDKIKYVPIRQEISDEIKDHIEDIKEYYIDNGDTDDIAIEKSIFDMGDPDEIGKVLNRIHKPKLDIKLILMSCILIIIGLMATYSLSNSIYQRGLGSETWFTKNIFYTIFGLFVGIIIYKTNYIKLKKHSIHIYIIATTIFLLSLITGNTENGIPHIIIPFVYVSISLPVIIVPLYILSFCGFIINLKIKNKSESFKVFILSILSILITFYCDSVIYALCLSISYFTIYLYNMFKSNQYTTKKKVLYIFITFFFIISTTMIFIASSPYRFERLKSIFVSNSYNFDAYQFDIKKNILVNANVFGRTDIEGMLTNEISLNEGAYGLVDARQTEILSYIIGIYGIFIGTLLIFCILLFFLHFLLNAKKIKEYYGKYVIIGISSMYIVQAILNVLSNLCLIQSNTALLPFVSCSGIDNAINIIILSFILSIYKRKDILTKMEKLEMA